MTIDWGTFHALWGAAKEGTYDNQAWKAFQEHLEEVDRELAEAKTDPGVLPDSLPAGSPGDLREALPATVEDDTGEVTDDSPAPNPDAEREAIEELKDTLL